MFKHANKSIITYTSHVLTCLRLKCFLLLKSLPCGLFNSALVALGLPALYRNKMVCYRPYA